MKQLIMAIVTALVSSISMVAGAAPVTVTDPWIAEAPPGVKTLAGYCVIENNGAQPLSLVGASSPVFGSVMMHRTVVQNGVARMEHLENMAIAPHGKVVFGPGNNHLMLMMPKHALHAGDNVAIQLRFKSGLQVPVTFKVRKTGNADGMGHMDQHGAQH